MKSKISYSHQTFLPLLIFILFILTGVIVLFSQIAFGNQSLRTWADISIILISLCLFLPGLAFLFVMIWLIDFIAGVNKKLPLWFVRIQIKVANISTFLISFARSLPKPLILFKSTINILTSLIHKK